MASEISPIYKWSMWNLGKYNDVYIDCISNFQIFQKKWKLLTFERLKTLEKQNPPLVSKKASLINNFSSKERTLTLAEVQNFILNYMQVTFKNYITPLPSPFLRNWKNISVAKDVTQLQTANKNTWL